MIALAIFSALVVAWRIRKGLFSRAEALAFAVVLANVILVWAQIVICDHRPMPEQRYYIQSTLLLYPWGIWGLVEILRRRGLPAGRILAVLIALFAVYDGIMLTKAHFPVGRRAAYVAACNWARGRIAADWEGPVRDVGLETSTWEYHTPYRPIVQAHSARLPYLLGGRDTSLSEFPVSDRPDYWFSDIRRDDPPTEGYERIDAFRRGKYEFHLYRRIR